jgi:hypothetical protein
MASFREGMKDWSAILQSIVTIAAVLLGGTWFIYQQSLKPELKLAQVVTKRPLDGVPDAWLISVEITATNTGKIREELTGGTLNIVQVNPLPGEVIFPNRPLLDLQLDPGEADQAFFGTFPVSDVRRTLEIQSRYPVARSALESFLPTWFVKKNSALVWHHDSVLDLGSLEVVKK